MYSETSNKGPFERLLCREVISIASCDNRNNHSTKDTLQGPKYSFSHFVNTFEHLRNAINDKMVDPNVSFVQRFQTLIFNIA